MSRGSLQTLAAYLTHFALVQKTLQGNFLKQGSLFSEVSMKDRLMVITSVVKHMSISD